MRRPLLALLMVVLLAGCAAQPKPLSREEWLAATTRTYEAKNKEQVIAAAERVLRLADGDDFTIVHADDGFDATRDWMAFIVIGLVTGTDRWAFRAIEESGGVKASVQVSLNASGTSANGIPTSVTGGLINGPALYELFWERMDYLLGLRGQWMDCKEADALRDTGATWGNNNPLCNSFNMTDSAPDGTLKQ